MQKVEFEWNGSTFVVTSTLLPKKLWQAASIDVFLDGKCLLRTGGVFKLTGSHSAQFEHEGIDHQVTLFWGHASLRSFPIKVEVDGATLHGGHVVSGNWPLSLWPWLALGGLISHMAWKS